MSDRTILLDLMEVISARKAEPPGAKSYVRSLLDRGIPKINEKIAEEAGEVVSASDEPGDAGRAHLVHEVADLFFHTLVLLGYRDIPGPTSRPSCADASAPAGSPRRNAEAVVSDGLGVPNSTWNDGDPGAMLIASNLTGTTTFSGCHAYVLVSMSASLSDGGEHAYEYVSMAPIYVLLK